MQVFLLFETLDNVVWDKACQICRNMVIYTFNMENFHESPVRVFRSCVFTPDPLMYLNQKLMNTNFNVDYWPPLLKRVTLKPAFLVFLLQKYVYILYKCSVKEKSIICIYFISKLIEKFLQMNKIALYFLVEQRKGQILLDPVMCP